MEERRMETEREGGKHRYRYPAAFGRCDRRATEYTPSEEEREERLASNRKLESKEGGRRVGGGESGR